MKRIPDKWNGKLKPEDAQVLVEVMEQLDDCLKENAELKQKLKECQKKKGKK